MTLIECFDEFAAQNIASCLYLRPEKLIFVGDRAQIEPYLHRYRALLADRNMSTRVSCRYVSREPMEQIVGVLEEIVREEAECVIDIAGGEERILLAIGAMLAGLDEHQREKVTVQSMDAATGTIRVLEGNAGVVAGQPVRLSVRELVRLQGGILHPTTVQPGREYTASDLDELWELVCRDPRAWNRSIAALRELESRADSDEQVFLWLPALRGSIANWEEKLNQVRSLLAQLHRCGVIHDRSRGDYLEYTYTSPLMRLCTLKAGNILENKALLEARELQDRGKPYFHDCQMGVHIDWDGVVHDPTKRIPETRNEIDLILVRGMTPLFVSCKNGDIGEAELYKLQTVASQFGGPHAKKMLIATDMDGKNPGSGGAMIQRARDMDIFLVTDAAELTKRDWADLFIKAMQR